MNIEYAKSIIQKTADDYDQIAGHFSITRYRNWPEISEAIIKYAKKDQNMLDIGCGNCRLLSQLPDQINYTGIDISSKLISEAKNNISKFQKSQQNIQLQVGNILNIPSRDNHFDLVFAIAVLHHIPSPEFRQQAIQEIYRVLKPNGILIMTNWNLNQPKYIKYINKDYSTDPNLEENDALIPWKNSSGKILAQRYCHVFSIDEIQNLLINNNFSQVINFINKYNILSIFKKEVTK